VQASRDLAAIATAVNQIQDELRCIRRDLNNHVFPMVGSTSTDHPIQSYGNASPRRFNRRPSKGVCDPERSPSKDPDKAGRKHSLASLCSEQSRKIDFALDSEPYTPVAQEGSRLANANRHEARLPSLDSATGARILSAAAVVEFDDTWKKDGFSTSLSETPQETPATTFALRHMGSMRSSMSNAVSTRSELMLARPSERETTTRNSALILRVARTLSEERMCINVRESLQTDMQDLVALQDLEGKVCVHLGDLQIDGAEREETSLETHTCIIEPASRLRFTIDILSLMVLLYDLVLTPFAIAWEVDMTGILAIGTYITASFWICDLIVSFRTGYYTQGRLEMSPRRIALHYMKRTFIIDLVVIVTDLLSAAVASEQNNGGSVPADVIRLTKIGRMLRIIGVLRVSHLAEIFARLSVRYAGVGVGLNILRILFVMIYINHVGACMWFFVGMYAVSDTGSHWLDDAGALSGETYRHLSRRYQYTTCFHFSLTQMTPGSMQVHAVNSRERVVTCLCLLMGLLTFGTLVSSLSTMMLDIRQRAERQVHQLTQLRRYLRVLAVPSKMAFSLEHAVIQRLRYQRPWTHHDVEALELLSAHQRLDLDVQVYAPHILMFPIIRLCCQVDRGLMQKLVRGVVDMKFFDATTLVFDSGKTAVATYVITSGKVGYTLETGRGGEVEDEVEVGGVLAEAALWCDWRHTGTAVPGHSGSVILEVNCEGFATAIQTRRLIKDIICEYAQHFCKQLLKYTEQSVDGSMPFEMPDDVNVSQRFNDDIFLSMQHPVQTITGLAAISILKEQERPDRLHYAMHASSAKALEKSFDVLVEEVHSHKSVLVTSPTGEVQRLACVACLRIRRSEDSCIFVEVGKVRNNKFVPGCELLGTLMTELHGAGGSAMAALTPLVTGGKLAAFDGVLRFEGIQYEVESSESKKHGVPTKYIKHIQEAMLDCPADKQLPFTVRLTEIPNRRASKRDLISVTGSTDNQSMRELSGQPKAQMHLSYGHQDGPFVGTWMTPEDFEYWRQPARSGALVKWLEKFHLEEALQGASENSTEIRKITFL